MGTTSNPHGPYVQGYTRVTMAGTMGSNTVRWSKTRKAGPSSDCGLQLAHMKSELLVMARQQQRREYVPGPCTHRPSHHESPLQQKSVLQPARGETAKVVVGDWGEVVTR